jgi:hypothetical protein
MDVPRTAPDRLSPARSEPVSGGKMGLGVAIAGAFLMLAGLLVIGAARNWGRGASFNDILMKKGATICSVGLGATLLGLSASLSSGSAHHVRRG